MTAVEATLHDWEAWLQVNDPRALEDAGPGLTDERIDELLAPLAPWQPPASIRTLYRWHNGAPYWLLPGWRFETLEHVIELFLGLRSEPPFAVLGLPVFSVDAPVFCELYLDPPDDGPLWVLHKGDHETFAPVPDLATALRVALHLVSLPTLGWSTTYGLIFADKAGLEDAPELLATHDPGALSRFGLDRLPGPIDVFDPDVWPALWRQRASETFGPAVLDGPTYLFEQR